MTRHELKEEIKTILANRLGSEPGGFPENSEGGRALVMLQELQKLEACEVQGDVVGNAVCRDQIERASQRRRASPWWANDFVRMNTL